MSHRPHQPKHPGASSASGGPRGTQAGPERAAGAICWRPGTDGRLELLLVRNTRWNEWSWPKGKLDPGETLPECAVREVGEETGVRVELGVPLPSVGYRLPDGRDKTVNYWAGRVREIGPRSALSDEISDVEWLPVDAARERLSRLGDLEPLQALLELAEHGRLDTQPLLIVRHAKARSRAHWKGTEADRPLTTSGLRQAHALAGLLACWQPERVLCSPWTRCMHTLRPYLDLLDKREPGDRPRAERSEPEVLLLLSEQGLHNDPERIKVTIAELLEGRRGALVCTHRPVLEVVFAALAEAATNPVREQLPAEDPWLTPAEILVAHVSDDRQHTVTKRIHTVEQFRGESPRNTLP